MMATQLELQAAAYTICDAIEAANDTTRDFTTREFTAHLDREQLVTCLGVAVGFLIGSCGQMAEDLNIPFSTVVDTLRRVVPQ